MKSAMNSIFLCAIMTMIQTCCQEGERSALLRNFAVGAISGAGAMAVYTPFHYFQNRRIQNLPIAWAAPSNWFRGLGSLALGKAPTMATQLATYELIKKAMQAKKHELSNTDEFLAATLAGSVSGVVSNFTHLVALHQENSGKSFVQAMSVFSRDKKSLGRGLGVTVMREIIFSNIFLKLLKQIQAVIGTQIKNETVANISGGLASGVVIAGATQPFMVVSANLYADIERKEYRNGFHAAYKILTRHGLFGFYTGTAFRSAGIILAIPVLNAIQRYFQKN